MPILRVPVRGGPCRRRTPASAGHPARGCWATSLLCLFSIWQPLPSRNSPWGQEQPRPLQLQPEVRLLGKGTGLSRAEGLGKRTRHQDGDPGGSLPSPGCRWLSAPPHGFMGALMGIQSSMWDPTRGSPHVQGVSRC